MKPTTYIVTVRVKGGAWRGMCRSFQVTVDAVGKDAACDVAMDKVARAIAGEFDSMTAKAVKERAS